MSNPYPFDPKFELVIALYTSTSPRFFRTIGRLLDPEAMVTKEAALAVQAAQAIAADTGNPPDAVLTVIQRIRRWIDEGHRSPQQLVAMATALDGIAYGQQLPSEEAVIEEAKPVLKRVAFDEITRATIDENAKGGDMERISTAISAAGQIGIVEWKPGVTAGSVDVASVVRKAGGPTLSFCIDKIDQDMGWKIGEMLTVMADSGGGKSLYLNQIAAVARLTGRSVAYATLELPADTVKARHFAALTSVPTDDCLDGTGTALATKRMEELEAIGLAPVLIRHFTPGATSPAQLFEWVENEVVDKFGELPALVVVDYGDLLYWPEKVSEVQAQSKIWLALRIWAEENVRWVASAVQSRGRDDNKGGRKILDQQDIGSAIKKAQHTDILLSLNPDDSSIDPKSGRRRRTTRVHFCKNRTGKARFIEGPLHTDEPCGRAIATHLLADRWFPDL